MEAKHTPIPWLVHRMTSTYQIPIRSENGTWIGSVDAGRIGGGQEGQANAEYIVRACNAYEDLLAACKSVADLLENMPSKAYISVQNHPCWGLIEAAIANAEKEI